MGNFYTELRASEEKRSRDLAQYEDVCRRYSVALCEALQTVLKWPKDGIKLLEGEQPTLPYSKKGRWWCLDRDGFHFRVEFSSGTDWSVAFKWTIQALDGQKFMLIVSRQDPTKAFAVDAPDLDVLHDKVSEVADYVRAKLREDMRERTLADLVEGR